MGDCRTTSTVTASLSKLRCGILLHTHTAHWVMLSLPISVFLTKGRLRQLTVLSVGRAAGPPLSTTHRHLCSYSSIFHTSSHSSPASAPLPSAGEHEQGWAEGQRRGWLAVTVARIGPGRIRIGERKYDHWFDGDGQMTVMHLNGAKQTATITSRLVQTDRVKLQQVRPFLWPHQTATITSRLGQTDRVKLQQVRPFLWPHQTFLRVNGVFVSRLTLHRTLLYQQLKGPK